MLESTLDTVIDTKFLSNQYPNLKFKLNDQQLEEKNIVKRYLLINMKALRRDQFKHHLNQCRTSKMRFQ